ncbi:MAG: enoyl-CoA hydratase/isomerase family protein [Candidatus Thiodiazotropha sp.]
MNDEQRRVALFQAQPRGLGLFFRPAALSLAHVEQLHDAHSVLLDEKIVPAWPIGLVLTGPNLIRREKSTMSKFETITYVVENRVATISLNRPKTVNAISQRMRQELKLAIDDAEEKDDIRVVVLRSEGKGFSSGTDLTEGLAGYKTIDDQIQTEYKPLLIGIAESTKVYISSIHGACAGIGASLALTCDLSIMSEDAFLYIPFAALSLVPDGGMSYHLVKAMGYKQAYQLITESGRLSADECLQYGLINKVVSGESLVERTQAWAEKLSAGAPLAQKFGKQIMRQVGGSSHENIFDMESKLQNHCTSSQDFADASRAFFEKRTPVFTGK